METYKCIRCGKVFEGYLLDGIYTCDYCEGELYTGEFYIDKVKEGNDMNFIEAIQEYKMITNDGGKTHYYKDAIDGMIFKSINGCGKIFNVTVGLLTSTGWEEYKEQKLIVPERVPEKYDIYYYIDTSRGYIGHDNDYMYDIDNDRLKIFNYFTDKDFAQYITDKQLIQRIELVLHHMNMFNPDILNKESLISDYVRDNYKEVLHRIKDYEMKNVEKRANKTTK